jgi:hypothetical protein
MFFKVRTVQHYPGKIGVAQLSIGEAALPSGIAFLKLSPVFWWSIVFRESYAREVVFAAQRLT